MCALYVETSEEIDELREINGLPIERIEARARPLEDKTQDVEEWMYRSHTGFLGEGESLKTVLRQDWELVVQRLGTTHLHLAAHLRALLTLAKPIKNEGEVSYDVTTVLGSTLAQPHGPQTIKVTRTFYMGEQFSLFFNPERPGSPDNQQWDVEYKIENASNGLSLCIGGDAEKGLVTYIRHYGFYEGGGTLPPSLLHRARSFFREIGCGNEYRVDPAILVALLTGSITLDCIDAVAAKEAERLNKQRAELDAEIGFETDCRSRLEEHRRRQEQDQKRDDALTSLIDRTEAELVWIQQRREQLEHAHQVARLLSQSFLARLREAL